MSLTKTICVCGAGTMGSGIAQVAAQAGFMTIQFDLNGEMLEKSRVSIEKNLQWQVNKGKLDVVTKEAILNRLSFTTVIEQCKAGVVIEAIIEQKEAKVGLFRRLQAINGSNCILATNTSSIPIGVIAEAIANPAVVVGMHFFNPAPVMKLVEVIKGDATASDVILKVVALAKQMGKTPVLCKDAPGFIVNRVARHYYLEAMRLIELGLADITTVDVMMEATGFKMGPFKLMDLIGMDINYSVSNIVWETLGMPERLRPSPVQKAKVDAGELGKKSGKGFYEYDQL